MSSSQKNLVIVRSVVDQGLTITQAAAKFGVSRQWVHRLLQRYRSGGTAAVLPQSNTPKSQPRITSPTARARIISLRQALVADGADAGPETIAWQLEREGYQAPSTSTIRRILHAAGLVTPQPKNIRNPHICALQPTFLMGAGKPISPTGFSLMAPAWRS